jgi:integral membrane protein (TIGR01906 family)
MALVNPSSAASQLGLVAVAISAALVLVAVAIVPYLNPLWVAFEQGRTNAAGLTGFSETDLRTVTNSILEDLMVGPPAFDVELNGAPVLSEAERLHMRDVRDVFSGFYGVASTGLAILAIAFWRAGRRRVGWTRGQAWRGVRLGATGLAAVVVVAGVIVTFAFDAAFEVFHRLFFADGSYLFDPDTDRLVQLFPEAFWSETAIAAGAMMFVLSIGAAWLGGRRGQGQAQ